MLLNIFKKRHIRNIVNEIYEEMAYNLEKIHILRENL